MSERSEFDRFVTALPKELEPQLVDGDTASTAFYQALRAGWEHDVLVQDALSRVRRGGKTGVIITRLRSLAENPPHARSDRRHPWEPPAYVPENKAALPASWVAERRTLLRRIRDEKIDPNRAEALMVALCETQKERSGIA